MKSIKDIVSIGIVLLATLGLILLVPANPFKNLDDPSYWGVIGYLLAFIWGAAIRLFERPAAHERLLLTLFLAGMPLIYLANWARFDGASAWGLFEILGLLIYGGLALFSRKRLLLLSIGIAAHGLWDLLHYNQALYVPNWYVLACALVDLAVGLYAFVRFRNNNSFKYITT